MITDYNATKFAIDIFDEMCDRYAYSPAVRRWPLRLFMHFTDAAAINAYVIQKGISSRRDFIHELADQLMKAQRERRAENSHWKIQIPQEIAKLYDR